MLPESLRIEDPKSAIKNFDKVIGELFLLLAVLAIFIVFWRETVGMDDQVAQLPRITIYVTIIMIAVGAVLLVLNSTRWEELLQPSFQSEDDDGEEVVGVSRYKGFDLSSATLEFSWSIVYVLGVLYIGFFTTNFLFTLVYMYWNGKGSRIQRLTTGVAWGAFICIGAYLLFVYILNNHIIFRLGMFP